MNVTEFLSRLTGVHETANGWQTKCPAHTDKKPSLSVAKGGDGRILLKCHAGCTPEAIAKKMGLKIRDLFPAPTDRLPEATGQTTCSETQASSPTPPGCTLEAYATERLLPLPFLIDLGITEITYQNAPALRIPYKAPDCSEKAVQFRIGMHGENRFRWKSGSKPMLYGLWRLDAAKAAGYVVLVEGASDCHTLWHHGIPAIGLPSATGWREDWASYFEGIERIYVVIEPDRGGETVKQWLGNSMIRDRVRLVSLAGVVQ